jgi:hypothetical protein
MNKLNLKHALLLDALADDGESMIQIENYFTTVNEKINREQIKQLILDLLTQKYIYVIFPKGATIENLLASYEDDFEGYWFAQTKEGRTYWEASIGTG